MEYTFDLFNARNFNAAMLYLEIAENFNALYTEEDLATKFNMNRFLIKQYFSLVKKLRTSLLLCYKKKFSDQSIKEAQRKFTELKVLLTLSRILKWNQQLILEIDSENARFHISRFESYYFWKDIAKKDSSTGKKHVLEIDELRYMVEIWFCADKYLASPSLPYLYMKSCDIKASKAALYLYDGSVLKSLSVPAAFDYLDEFDEKCTWKAEKLYGIESETPAFQWSVDYEQTKNVLSIMSGICEVLDFYLNTVKRLHLPLRNKALVVYEHPFCFRANHRLLKVKVALTNLKQEKVFIESYYCHDCQILFTTKRNLDTARDKSYFNNRLLIGKLSFPDYENSIPNINGFIDESSIRYWGYSVSSYSGLKDTERQRLLVYFIEAGIMSKYTLTSYLENRIRINGQSPSGKYAKVKWEQDLAFVNEYVSSPEKLEEYFGIREYPEENEIYLE